MLRAIETFYNGYRFRSRLEARWAVFFDSAGIEYVYEPEGFVVDNGLCYLPDFLIRNVIIVHGNSEPRIIPELYIEVKGKMTPNDARKVNKFAMFNPPFSFDKPKSESENSWPEKMHSDWYDNGEHHPIYILGDIPVGSNGYEIIEWLQNKCYLPPEGYDDNAEYAYPFNFETIDMDNFGAFPAVDDKGHLVLEGDDSTYWKWIFTERTIKAYNDARQARFEHGEKPKF